MDPNTYTPPTGDLPLWLRREDDPPSPPTTLTTTHPSPFFGQPPAGSQPVETSELAADALTPTELDKRRRRVLTYFSTVENATADEVLWHFAPATSYNGYAPRCSELLSVGYLERTAVRRPTRAGRPAFALRLTQQGRAVLEAGK